VSRFTFGKKGRRAAALGATGLGACALLAACAPVQAGSAAIVGNQRITVSSVDTQVSNLQAAVKHYDSSTLPASAPGAQEAQQPTAVLSWMIRFAVMDHLAADKGITISQAQQDAALSSLNSVAQQDGAANGTVLLLANGVPPQLFPDFGRWYAQDTAFGTQVNGGKAPSTQAEQDKINQAQCKAAEPLNIRVSPQFGRIDYAAASFGVVAADTPLSRPAGSASPASTEGLTAAAC